jgi:hypothetical protein
MSFNFILSTKLTQLVFKIAVPASHKIQAVSITTIMWLMLFREIIAVYSERLTKLCGQNAVNDDDIQNY